MKFKIWRRRRRKWGGGITKNGQKGEGAIKNFGAEGAGGGGGQEKKIEFQKIYSPPHILYDHSLMDIFLVF